MHLTTFATALPAVLIVAALAAPAASAQAPQGGPPSTIVVTTEAQYRQAVIDLAAAVVPATIVLDADITVTGASDPQYTGAQPLSIVGQGHTLSGGDTRRVLRSAPTTTAQLNLQQVVVADGFATNGGAVDWEGNVVVNESSLLGNNASDTNGSAGAIHAESVTVVDSVVVGNSATASTNNANGGAIYARGTLTVLRSTFRDNSATAVVAAGSGGAAFAIDGMTITDSWLEDNTITGVLNATGGAARTSGDMTVSGSWIGDNAAAGANAASGGGVHSPSGTITIDDSVFDGNEAASSGGTARGGAVLASTVDLTDSTVINNEVDGTSSLAAVSGTSDLTAVHATITGNTGNPASVQANDDLSLTATIVGEPTGGPNCDSLADIRIASVDDDGTCVSGAGNRANVDDVRLGPMRFNLGDVAGAPIDQIVLRSRFPLAGSPGIDLLAAGSCTDTLDRRGITRPFGAGCDAGDVEAVFEPHAFTDVDPWVEDAVRWLNSDVNDPALMVGLTPTQFGHELRIKRSQVVRLLYRLMDEPDPSAYPPHPFTDVPAWIEDAVRWAYGEEIVTGETPTLFEPDDFITRGQVVRMMYRVVGSPDVSGIDPPPFTDVPGWVADPIRWAANPDNPLPIMTGETPTQFDAEEDITRGQVARLVWRLALTPNAWEGSVDPPLTVLFSRGGF